MSASTISGPALQRHGSIFVTVQWQPFSTVCSSTPDLRLEMSGSSRGIQLQQTLTDNAGMRGGFDSIEKSSKGEKRQSEMVRR